ncbi:MAG: L-histidine N(alpha)-methyltransferase [Isosphaeraceae bacterium]
MSTRTIAPQKSDSGRIALIRLDERERRPTSTQALAAAVREGLTGPTKTLPCQYFYDEVGSALFERICELPEYYLTRTEDAILREHADAMVDFGSTEPPALVELGSGSAEKTRRLIAAALARHGALHYLPIDVSSTAVEESARQLTRTFPALKVTAFVGDYHGALPEIAGRVKGPKLIAFLGSSLGNYVTEDAVGLLRRVAAVMTPEDRFLLGTDMAKDAAILEPAYDDAQGLTARFNRNLLVRINRELHADFDRNHFAHKAVHRADLGRVEMHLVSLRTQTVNVPGANLSVTFDEGETIHTENSHKYTTETLAELSERSGFVEEASWTDPRGWFRLQRWRVRGIRGNGER